MSLLRKISNLEPHRWSASFMIFIAALCGGCATSNTTKTCYPTDGGLLAQYDDASRKRIIPPEKFAEAKELPESQPAEQDPTGHWGKPVTGFQIGLRLAANVFVSGNPITADMYVRNVSGRNLQYLVLVPDKYLRIEISRDGIPIRSNDELRNDGSFQSRVRGAVKDSSTPLLFAGTQHKIPLELSESYDLSQPGRYTIRAGRMIPGRELGASRDCLSGAAEFTVTSAAPP